MVQDGNSTPNVRHIDIKWWFANTHVDNGNVRVHPVRGNKNPVNGMTKPTTGAQFLAERSYMMGHVPGSANVAHVMAAFSGLMDMSNVFAYRARAATMVARAWRAKTRKQL